MSDGAGAPAIGGILAITLGVAEACKTVGR
jgi:hypothetical protein